MKKYVKNLKNEESKSELGTLVRKNLMKKETIEGEDTIRHFNHESFNEETEDYSDPSDENEEDSVRIFPEFNKNLFIFFI